VLDLALTDQEIRQVSALATGKRVNDQDPRTWEEF
jgi:hypothetical protein